MALYIIDMILEHQRATMCDVFEVDTSSSIAVLHCSTTLQPILCLLLPV